MNIRDKEAISMAKNAIVTLMQHYRHGAYRIIRDPEGVVSLWAIEGNPNAQFSISFVDKGRVYYNIEDVPGDLLRSFVKYVKKVG